MLYKALQIGEEIIDTAEITSSNQYLGFVYRNSDEYRKAIEYFNKFKVAAEYYNDDYMRLNFYTDAGRSYEQLNVLDTALLYYQQAYKLAISLQAKSKIPQGIQGVVGGFATVQSKLGNNAIAIELFRKSIDQSMQYEDYRTLARCYNELGKHFYRNNQFDSAIYYSKQALNINIQHSFLVQTLDAGKLITDIFKNEAKYDSAFKYQQITLAAKDSLFSREKISRMQNQEFNYRLYQQEVMAQQEQIRNMQKVYFLLAILFAFLLLAIILWRSNRNKQRAKLQIEKAYAELKSTQAQLIQSEKMASLGELTAGIAHEIQNPLNFVNNFSEVNVELIEELKSEKSKFEGENGELEDEILNDIEQNLQKILQHGKRADAIVKGMLQHSKASTGKKELIDINALADEYLRLSYHGMRAKDKTFNAEIKTDFDKSIGKVNVVPQDIGRVLLNLFNNAFYATRERQKAEGTEYNPTVSVTIKRVNSNRFGANSSPLGAEGLLISVSDNGNGIPQNIVDKIIQPFFTTKPTGQGTGLGLSLSYDIIKAHGGEIRVESKEGEGSKFVIQLPTL